MRISIIRRLAVLIMIALGAGGLAVAETTAVAAPDPDDPFVALRGFEPTGAEPRVEPRDFAASRVDPSALRSELPSRDGSVIVSVPDPSGAAQSFRVRRTQVMESKLAAAHPEIRTYAGRGVDDPRSSIALDVTPMGFHAFVRAPGASGDWFVDPAYNRRGTTAHLSYFGRDLPRPEKRRAEGEIRALRDTVEAAQQGRSTAPGQPVPRHFYRLALTSDPAYAAYFGTANVLAEKVTLINRVNQIYNNDLATELRLVNDTEKLNFDSEVEATGPNGPCGAAPCFELADDGGTPGDDSDDIPGELDTCDVSTLGKNRSVLGQLIGASNYDVGHIALGSNGGGVAFLGVVGGDYKGGGCTGLSVPKGDFFAIDYVAHEIGHQFSGNHTFNGALGSCGGNISDASVEPGSGSSVMAYAGICGRDDLQPHTDPYFSFRTVDEVDAYRAAPYDNIEVQTVSLRGLDTNGEKLTLGYEGETATVTRGVDYTNAGVEAALEKVTGEDVTVTPWGYDEVVDSDDEGNPIVGPIDDTGFQVIFNDAPTVFEVAGPDDVDLPSLAVSGSAGVTGFVGETAQGGPSFNDGIDLPGSEEVADNAAPTVKAPEARTIPVRTPFALTGSGADTDGDRLVYLWEQTNNGAEAGAELSASPKVYGPLFRVFGDDAVVSEEDSQTSPAPGINIADGSPTRVFPDMAQILAGNTNAATGACPAVTTPVDQQLPNTLLDCYSEFLPTADYLGSLGVGDKALRFRLTARDLFPNGGGLAFADVALTVDPSAGPFEVTSQAKADAAVPGGARVPVTWAVNNTQRLAADVRISLSTDGGAGFGTVLAASTPNDGSHELTMPNITARDVRLKIEAVDNYFFDVNDAPFRLTAAPAPETPDTTITAGPRTGSVVVDAEQSFTYSSTLSPATFVCSVDGDPAPCAVDGLTTTFAAGTHVFAVAAINAAGVADPTPATRSFTVPRDDGALGREGRWRRVEDESAFGGDYVTSRQVGAELVTRIREATRIALVVSTRRGAGSVKVFIGDDRVETLSVEGPDRSSRLRTVGFDQPRSGRLRIVVNQPKPVRIEGVAVVADAEPSRP